MTIKRNVLLVLKINTKYKINEVNTYSFVCQIEAKMQKILVSNLICRVLFAIAAKTNSMSAVIAMLLFNIIILVSRDNKTDSVLSLRNSKKK